MKGREKSQAGASALQAPRGRATRSPKGEAWWAGRTRTCNQTVMSDGISISFVDFVVVSFTFDRVYCASFRSFLVRNWCGSFGGTSNATHNPTGRYRGRQSQTRTASPVG